MYSSQPAKTNRSDHYHFRDQQQQQQRQSQETSKQQRIVQIYDTANHLSDLLQTGLSPPACEAVIDLLRAGVEPDKVIAMVQQLHQQQHQQQQQQRAPTAEHQSSPSNQSKFLRMALEMHKKQSSKESSSSLQQQQANATASRSVGGGSTNIGGPRYDVRL